MAAAVFMVDTLGDDGYGGDAATWDVYLGDKHGEKLSTAESFASEGRAYRRARKLAEEHGVEVERV
jgi:hypothetical protein